MFKLRLLIVDDQPNLLESFKIALELKGYAVSIASSGREALQKCEHEEFDAVLLNIRMPEMDGVETLRHLKQLSPDQVVIMFTAHCSQESAIEALRVGAYDYLEKPSTSEAVDLCIQKAVGSHKLLKANRFTLQSAGR